MMGLMGSVFGMGCVILPMLITTLMEKYGFRGCLAVVAAINLHLVLAMIAMFPNIRKVSQHKDNALVVNDSSIEVTTKENSTHSIWLVASWSMHQDNQQLFIVCIG